jgi:transposase-like protein
MDLSLPGARQGWKYHRFLSFAHTKRQSGEALPGKALNGRNEWEQPDIINTDKAPTYGRAISELKAKR